VLLLTGRTTYQIHGISQMQPVEVLWAFGVRETGSVRAFPRQEAAPVLFHSLKSELQVPFGVKAGDRLRSLTGELVWSNVLADGDIVFLAPEYPRS
jgi:hypothetical protein